MNLLLFFVAPIVSLLISLKSYETVQVTVKQGILEGIVSTSRNGSKFYSFYGIPYAKPPIYELRYASPKEPGNWMGVRKSTKPPPVCIKLTPESLPGNITEGDEDCLYLNVFTPGAAASSQLPVMVYFHGDEFSCGGSMYGPEYLMDHQVVVVIIQYRVGIFGFLSVARTHLPGNYGLKDQVAALKWVQENIVAFGGDQKRVTIVGRGSAAGSVNLHLYSPLSTGLFHGAIIQSGSALAPWALAESQTVRDRAEIIRALGICAFRFARSFVDCLRKTPDRQLLYNAREVYTYDINPAIPFPPVIEPKNVSDAFLTENPWRLEVINSVPVVIGLTAEDGIVLSSKDSKKSNITKAIKNHYFEDNDISLKNIKNFTEMFTDGLFTATSLEAAQRVNNTVYFYLYDHQNEYSFSELGKKGTNERGVSHGDDLISLFNLEGTFPSIKKGPTTDYAVSERMVNYWINFVKNGDPNGEKKIWSPFRSDNFAYLHIKSESDDMEEKLRFNNYACWRDNFFPILKSQI